MIDLESIRSWFSYHKPSPDQVNVMEAWRCTMTELASDFVQLSPDGPDQTVALRKMKEALMAMNAALVSPSPKRKQG